MKQVYLLSLLFFVGFTAFGQSTTVTINATGAAGSYKTGYINNTAVPSRNDGDMQVRWAAASPTGDKRGWAVFNLPSVMPPSATVTAVKLKFTINATANATNPSAGIFGYVGDLSTVTVPATVFTGCNGNGAYSGLNLCTTSWGGAVATVLLTLNASGIGFINTNAASMVSLGFQSFSNAGQTYTITGEGGTAGTQPQLQVTYNCTGVSGTTASVAPNPVCVGSTVTLTKGGTGTTTYLWNGPGGFTSTLMNPTFTASVTSAGIYTLTAYNAGGCPTIVTTNALVVNPSPAAISGASFVCFPGSTTLSNSSGAGTWASSATGVATVVATTGSVTATSAGTTTITFTLNSTGCKITRVESVNATPVAISGTLGLCPANTTTLSDVTGGGTWSSSVPTIGSIGSATGIVAGVLTGTTMVTYNNGCGTPATAIVTVYPIPATITGPANVCPGGGTITLNDATSGGTWSSVPTSVATAATAGPNNGIITGVSPGTATITYTSSLGCINTTIVSVDPLPAPIEGVLNECASTSSTLSDAITGGTWSSSAPTIGSIGSTSGILDALSGGTTVITYATGCGYVTAIDTSITAPSPLIGTDSVCVGASTTFASLPSSGGTWSSSASGVATVLYTSGLVTGVAAGTAFITYTIPPGCFVVGTIRVMPLPPAITGTKRTCPGATTTLHNTSTGGTWSSLETYIATVNSANGIVTGVVADTAHIIYTSRSGCLIATTITVNPLPAPIVGGVKTCATLNDTLYDATVGGTWSSGTPGIASVNATGIVTTISGGTAVISYTLPTGCAASKSFSVNPSPAAIVTFNGFTNTFYTGNFYVDYQWYCTVQNLIPGATTYSTAGLYNGYYWVIVTDTNGCVATSVPYAYNTAMAVVTHNNTVLRIYPNPANNEVNIESETRVRAVISNMDGKIEMEQENAKKLNISKLPAGMYFIALYGDDGKQVTTQKLLKH